MAASDAQSKKRKGATDSQPKAKKARKSDDITAAKPTRKEAADFFSDDDTPASVKAPKSKKSKKSKATEPADAETAKVEEVVVSEKPKKKAKKGKKAEEAQIAVTEEDIQDVLAGAEEQKRKEKKTKKPKKAVIDEEPAVEPVREEVAVVVEEKKPNKGKKSKKQKEAAVVEDEEAAVAEDKDAEEEEALDDQTAALLAGFESDRDESDLEKEDEEFDEDALAETGKEISKKKRKELEKARRDAEPGVIYLGRIPHGFFEPQMKKYFSQFGTVLRLRLSRNKKTGASKHYAFVEFANGEVADIVAKTMHNYLMFGHILQCRVVPSEQVHAELFKGANERFKVDPRNQKEGAALARGATRDVWEKRVQRENKKRAGKAKALLEEFDYEFNAPAVKSVDSVPKKTAAIEDAPAQALLTQGQADAEPEADTASAVDEAAEKKSKKASKNKKRKSDVVPEAIEEPEVPAPKSKKAKKESQPQSEVVTDKKRKVSQNGASTKKVKKAKA